MKILIGCATSGTLRDMIIKNGHNAISCDTQMCHLPGPHYWGNILDILYQDWDAIISFPPCTYLANVGAKHLYGKRGNSRLKYMAEAASFFNRFLDHPCKKIAVENPKHFYASKELILRPHDQVVQPYQFGCPYTKRTHLWLKGLPKLVPTNIVKPVETWIPGSSARLDTTNANRRSKYERSIVCPGIERAMADQWFPKI